MAEDEKEPFRFLTTEEFNQLTQDERMGYLVRAIEFLNAAGQIPDPSDEDEPHLDPPAADQP